MPPSLLLVVLLLASSAWSFANKRHVSGEASYSNSGASSFASSAAYSSGSSYSGAGGVKGGCGGCGQSGFGSSAAASHPSSASFSGGFGSGTGGSASSFASAGNSGGFPGGQNPADVAFWWAGADSPFKKAQEFYKRCALKGDCGNPPGPIKIPGFDPNSSPCGPQGCLSKTPNNQPIDISNNPFLNGEYKGISVSSCSGAGCPGGKPSITVTNCKGAQCNTFKHEGQPEQTDYSRNPFLSGLAGDSSFKSSHGAGSDIAHSKNTAYGSESGQESRPTPQSQTGHTTSYQHGTTSFGTSANSSNSFAHGQTYPTAPSNTGSSSFVTSGSGSFGNSGHGQSGSGCSTGSNCHQVPSKEITPPPFGNQNNKPGCYPGQPSCQNGGSLSGSYPSEPNPSESDYRPGQQCHPGQPRCESSKPQSAPICYPGQPGCSRPQNKPQFGSYQPKKQCYPGQPGCGQNQPQSIPTCYPGQPGCSRTQEKPQSISTCYPGQSGCSQLISSYPEQKPEPVPPCYPGQPGCSSSSTLTSRPAYTTGFPNSGSSSFSSSGSGANSYSGGSSSPGSYPGRFPQHEPEGELTLKCGGADYFCVEKRLCNNGIINTNGEDQFERRTGDRYCNVNSEVCCRLLPKQPEQQQPNYYHSSHSTSGARASAGATTYLTSGPNPGPTIASQIANQYTPQHSHQPDSRFSQPNQPGLIHIPPKDAKPGQSIPFAGSHGNSPGVIHVVQDSSSSRPFTSGSSQYYPQQIQPGIQVRPNGELPRPFTSEPGFVQVSHNGGSPRPNNFINELGSATAAATIRGPAYLPPDASPTPTTYTDDLLPPVSPSPSAISPNVLIPQRPSTPRVIYTPPPTTQRVIYTPPTTPKIYYSPQSTTPRPTYYQPTTPRKEYIPPQYPSGTSNANEYIPPGGTSIVSTAIPPRTTTRRPYSPQVPDSNIININILKPSTDPPLRPIRPTDTPLRPEGAGTSESRLRPPTSPRPMEYPFKGVLNTTPYPGCPAALKCVEAQFCTADAVISTVPVILSREQEIMRVPTTECADPETGIIGRCCRDPNYKDPWPASQLGLYNPNDGFDNGQYKETRTEGRYKRPPPGVKGQPGVKGRPQSRPYEPNQLGAASNIPGTFVRPDQGYPSQVPNIPFDSRQVSRPVQVDVKNPVEYNFNGKQPYSPSKISSPTCGARRPGGSPRGQAPNDVDFAEIPWQAMILRDSNRSLLCGGAIIRRDAVLTAASCVEGLHSDDILVKGGEWKLGIDEEPKPFQIIKTAAIVRHPGYNPQTKLNDVAILVLSEKFRIDRNVDTICLPAPNTDIETTFKEAKCITTGWGKTILQLHLLNALMHSLDVGVVPAPQCQQVLQQLHSTNAQYYNTNCLCGATTQPNKDICDVDIGSALACDLGDGRYTLAGVYSWDTGCRSQSQLAGYTKVDTLWIESTLQRPVNDLKIEENGFYQRLSNPHQHTGPECHCQNGKK